VHANTQTHTRKCTCNWRATIVTVTAVQRCPLLNPVQRRHCDTVHSKTKQKRKNNNAVVKKKHEMKTTNQRCSSRSMLLLLLDVCVCVYVDQCKSSLVIIIRRQRWRGSMLRKTSVIMSSLLFRLFLPTDFLFLFFNLTRQLESHYWRSSI